MPIVSQPSGKRSGDAWIRALFGIVIVGVLVVALVLVQRGDLNLAPQDVAQPVPPLAQEMAQAYRGPIFVEPVPVRAVRRNRVSEPAIKSASAKSRSGSGLAAGKSEHRLAGHQVADPASGVPEPPVPTCEGLEDADLARCMRPQIVDADLQLRTAYSDAVKAGVERRKLVVYRREWSKLRKRANSEPRRVAAGFREIAQELNVARTGDRPSGNECRLSRRVCAVLDDR